MEQRPKLLDKVREIIRLKHYSKKTEESYLYWIKKFLRHHKFRPPREMGRAEIEEFLAYRPKNVPTVLTASEARAILDRMAGMHALMAKLLYGSGLRVSECVQLRVKDIDFEQHQIVVHDGKGEKDRLTMLPESLKGVKTTMIYTHVLNKGPKAVKSPLDR